MMVQKAEDPEFSIIPVVLGENVPDFPFHRSVLWVDFRDPKEYRKAFYRLICAIENKPPGSEVVLEGDLELPPSPGEETGRQPQQDEISFVEELFELFYTKQAVLLLAQADRGQGAMKSYLLERAEKQYSKANVLHLVPPYGSQTDLEDYFSVLGKQCHFSEKITNAVSLMTAFEDRLIEGKRLFLLVSGFENGCESGRVELAGVLRSLNERYPSELRILICGGEKLVDLYYTGTLSFLNQAEEREWPELTVADVQIMQKQVWPEQTIDNKTAQTLLDVSGGHPRLLEHCLSLCREERLSESKETPGVSPVFDPNICHDALAQSPFVWQLFTPFVQDTANTQRLCQLLEQHEVGPAQPYLFDPLLRRLYWKNLLKRDNKRRLVWRCEAFRAAGRQILGCEDVTCTT